MKQHSGHKGHHSHHSGHHKRHHGESHDPHGHYSHSKHSMHKEREHDTGMNDHTREKPHFGKDVSASKGALWDRYEHQGGKEIHKCRPSGKMS